jgi:tetratricopeptide (TPR) repeat protein
MSGGNAPQLELLEFHLQNSQSSRLAGKLDEATEHISAAFRINSHSVPVLMEMGLLHQQRGEWTEARKFFELVQTTQPDNPQILDAIGHTWQAQNNFDKAMDYWRCAVKINPDYADAWQNLGLAHEHQDELPEAIACHQKVTALLPKQSKSHRLLGTAQLDYGLLSAARQCFNRAIELAPDDPEAIWQRFFLRALAGEFPDAWVDYECRFHLPSRTTPDHGFVAPRWRGEMLPGKTLLLHAEQGYGDTLQMVRYAPRVAERADRILLWAPKSLLTLLSTVSDIDEVVSDKPPEDTFHAHSPLMSLPGVFGDSLETLPKKVPYLGNYPQTNTKKTVKIGLAWAGSGNQPLDRRSVLLSELAPLISVNEVSWHSLQLGPEAAQIANSGWTDLIHDNSEQLNDFAATATMMAELDLIICVDSAVAHLAGALGKPVWVLLSFAPDWRWGWEGEISPWYPSARLFRQKYGETWSSVGERMTTALRSLVG